MRSQKALTILLMAGLDLWQEDYFVSQEWLYGDN